MKNKCEWYKHTFIKCHALWIALTVSNLSWSLCTSTDAATQLKDTATDSPLNSRDHSGQSQSPSKSTQTLHSTSSSSLLPASSSTPETIDSEAEPARFVSSAQGFAGGTTISAHHRINAVEEHIQFILYRKYSMSKNYRIQLSSWVWRCDFCFVWVTFFPLHVLLFQQRPYSSPQLVPFSLLQ